MSNISEREYRSINMGYSFAMRTQISSGLPDEVSLIALDTVGVNVVVVTVEKSGELRFDQHIFNTSTGFK